MVMDAMDDESWAAWINTPGFPPVKFNFTTNASEVAKAYGDAYVAAKGGEPSIHYNYTEWFSNQKVLFILAIQDKLADVTIDVLKKIDKDWNITLTLNPEVKQRWYPIGIAKNYTDVFEPAHEFISVQGRMKYLNPIYIALVEYGHRDLALKWFNENKSFYHPIAVRTL